MSCLWFRKKRRQRPLIPLSALEESDREGIYCWLTAADKEEPLIDSDLDEPDAKPIEIVNGRILSTATIKK